MTSKAMAAAPAWVSRVDQFGNARARPRPLPELAQALLVDIDDHDRAAASATRGDDQLEEIEGPEPQFFKRARVPPPQSQQREQQPHAEDARGQETPSLTREPFHAEPAGSQLIRRGLPRHFSRNTRIS